MSDTTLSDESSAHSRASTRLPKKKARNHASNRPPKASSARILFNFVFAVPLAFFSAARTSTNTVLSFASGAASSTGTMIQSMSGTMEFQMVSKLYGASCDLFSGFMELGALGLAMTLLLWVSGLFFGLAFCSVFVSMGCLYVLACATGMNWVLDRVRKYLRDCFLLRVCAVTIPVVTVIKGLRFTTGVTVHFPDKSMVWILHAGHWVVRLCWRSFFEPRVLITAGAGKGRPAQQSQPSPAVGTNAPAG